MSFDVIAEPVPLTTDADGVVRIGSTRVTLDSVVAAFREGLTAEGIAVQYPTVRLADLYSVIGYILAHTEQVDSYLLERQRLASDVRKQNEAHFDPNGIRERLSARMPG